MEIRTDSIYKMNEPIWEGGSFNRGRRYGKPRKIGDRIWTGRVVRHGYGDSGQHSITFEIIDAGNSGYEIGKKRIRKARNVYDNGELLKAGRERTDAEKAASEAAKIRREFPRLTSVYEISLEVERIKNES